VEKDIPHKGNQKTAQAAIPVANELDNKSKL
jgi:hypothetical protein